MKQNITVEQLNELSEKGKERLREWWKPQEGDWVVNKATHPKSGKKYDIPLCMSSPSAFMWEQMIRDGLVLLSIGQMIEFLDENGLEITRHKSNSADHLWEVSRKSKKWESFLYKELADVLWQAVKEILESKHKPPIK